MIDLPAAAFRRILSDAWLRYACMHAGTHTEPYPITPDGRYFVVRARLWRRSDPSLSATERERLVSMLMHARRDVGTAKRREDSGSEKAARARVDLAKRELGERGPVWWGDGAPDLNRRMMSGTDYAGWYAAIAGDLPK